MDANKVTEVFIGIIIFVAVAVAFIPYLLSWFTNLSGSGLALAVLFATILPLILAVAVFRAVWKSLKF